MLCLCNIYSNSIIIKIQNISDAFAAVVVLNYRLVENLTFFVGFHVSQVAQLATC